MKFLEEAAQAFESHTVEKEERERFPPYLPITRHFHRMITTCQDQDNASLNYALYEVEYRRPVYGRPLGYLAPQLRKGTRQPCSGAAAPSTSASAFARSQRASASGVISISTTGAPVGRMAACMYAGTLAEIQW